MDDGLQIILLFVASIIVVFAFFIVNINDNAPEESLSTDITYLEFEQEFVFYNVDDYAKKYNSLTTENGFTANMNLNDNEHEPNITNALFYENDGDYLFKIGFYQTDILYGISINNETISMTHGLLPMDTNIPTCKNPPAICFPTQDRLVYVIEELTPNIVTIDEDLLQKHNDNIIKTDRIGNKILIDIEPSNIMPETEYHHNILSLDVMFIPLKIPSIEGCGNCDDEDNTGFTPPDGCELFGNSTYLYECDDGSIGASGGGAGGTSIISNDMNDCENYSCGVGDDYGIGYTNCQDGWECIWKDGIVVTMTRYENGVNCDDGCSTIASGWVEP